MKQPSEPEPTAAPDKSEYGSGCVEVLASANVQYALFDRIEPLDAAGRDHGVVFERDA